MLGFVDHSKKHLLLWTGIASILVACTPAKPDSKKTLESNADKLEQTVTPTEVFSPTVENASMENQVTRTTKPGWVIERTIPEFPKARMAAVQNGIAYLMSDDQYRLAEDGYDYTYSIAYEITDRTGLEGAAQISQVFDPQTQSLSFHTINIIRAGKTIEKLADVEIKELQREQNLSDGLLGGDITALIHLDDVKVGDIITYSFSLDTKTPLWPGDFFTNAKLKWSVPLPQYNFRLLAPKDKKFYFKPIDTNVEVTQKDVDDWIEYSFGLKNPEPFKSASNLPVGYLKDRLISITTMESWNDVARWGSDIYKLDYKLPADFRNKIRKIKRKYKKPEDRITEALRIVQNDIRYLGIEIGTGSYVPRPPETTLQLGYGDCKDKTVLLIAALKEMDIPAWPALVNTDSGQIINNVLPSITIFNHVIVGTRVGGEDLWVDPTLSHQGGRVGGTLAQPEYGYALPLLENASIMVKMPTFIPAEPEYTVHEKYTFPENGDTAMTLEVESSYQGSYADERRHSTANKGTDKISKSYLDYYANLYPGLVSASNVKVEDDLEANHFKLTETYTLDRENFEKNEMDKSLSIKSYAIKDKLPTSIGADRIDPLGIRSNLNLEHKITIITPGRQSGVPENVSKSAPGIEYTRKYSTKEDKFEIITRLKTKQTSIPLEKTQEALDLADEISDAIELVVHLDKFAPDLATRIGYDGEILVDIKKDLNDIGHLLGKKQRVEALSALNKLAKSYTKKDPLRGYIQVLRASTMSDMGRTKAAYPAYKEGFSLYEPTSASVYFDYLDLLVDKKKYDAAGKVATRFLKKLPEDVGKLNLDWFGSFSGKLFIEDKIKTRNEMLLAAAAALHGQKDKEGIDPRSWIFSEAVPLLVKQGKPEQAADYLDYLHSPNQMQFLMMDKKMSSLWPQLEEKAGKDLSKAIISYVAYALEKTKAEDADYKDKARYVSALNKAGKFKEALAYAEPILENWAEIEAVGEDAYWFVNTHAYTLYNMNRIDESNHVFDKLLALGVEENSDLISMAINQADFLLSGGKYQAALDKVKIIENYDEDMTSDTGKIYYLDVKACALYKLGRKDEANRVFDEQLKPLVKNQIAAEMKTLVCLERMNEAEKILITRIETEKFQDGTFQVFTKSKRGKNEPKQHADFLDQMDKLKARPAIQKAADKYLRPITVKGERIIWGEY